MQIAVLMPCPECGLYEKRIKSYKYIITKHYKRRILELPSSHRRDYWITYLFDIYLLLAHTPRLMLYRGKYDCKKYYCARLLTSQNELNPERILSNRLKYIQHFKSVAQWFHRTIRKCHWSKNWTPYMIIGTVRLS